MQEVPVIFFARDFDFAHPDTFAAVCGDSSVPPTLVRKQSAIAVTLAARLTAPLRSRWCCRSG